MKPRAMSEWISSAASSAVWPRRSVHARASVSPPVKNVIRSSASRSLRTTSSRADGPSRNSAASVFGELGELELEREIDAARAVLHDDARLRRQRLELLGHLACVVAEGAAGVEMREQRLERGRLSPQPRITRLRLRSHALEPRLDVVAVCDEQLQLELLEVAGGIGARREPVDHAQQRVDAPEVAEQRRAGAGHVLHADRGRRRLRRAVHARDVGSRRGRRSRAMPTCSFASWTEHRRASAR